MIRNSFFSVFHAMLSVFVVAQIPTFFVPALPACRAFAEWYAGLPIR